MDETSLEEYRLNVDLWKHDDALRQSHNQTFLGVNSAVLVAAGLVISASGELVIQGLTALAASVFGLAICGVWRRVQIRHNAYIRFHRKMLVALEAPLSFSTFRLQEDAFHEPWSLIEMPHIASEFRLKKNERRSASGAEARLPEIVGVLWILAAAAGISAMVCG